MVVLRTIQASINESCQPQPSYLTYQHIFLTIYSQHFQGLRRSQGKGESAESPVAQPSSSVDPTLNPITRRPGPGRGRPRKSQASGAEAATASPTANTNAVEDKNMLLADMAQSGEQQLQSDQAGHLEPQATNPSAVPEHQPEDVEHAAKRQRLDDDHMDEDDGLDDEAVLALAAHGGSAVGDSYTAE